MTAAQHRRRAPALLTALGTALLLSACGGTGATHYSASRALPAGHPHYTVAPYQINGVWYYPKADYAYDQTGTASWYGPQFDQRQTADGEVFDMNRLSAAHKTLPLPSVVEVTNLDNGRSLELRVNDRGPFVGDRLINVSRRAAQLLGFQTAGTAPVRVRILKEPSIEVAEAARRGEAAPVLAADAPPPSRPARPPAPVRLAALPPPAPVRLAALLPPAPSATPSRPAAKPVPPPIATPAPAPMPPAPIRFAEIRPRPVIETAAAPAPAPAARPALSPHNFANRIEAALFPPAAAATYEPPRARRLPPAGLSQLAAAVPAGRIFVQAGAFSQRDNAERVQARIARLGAAQVTAARVHGTELYRVRLGPLTSVEAANALLARVVGSGYAGARIVGD